MILKSAAGAGYASGAERAAISAEMSMAGEKRLQWASVATCVPIQDFATPTTQAVKQLVEVGGGRERIDQRAAQGGDSTMRRGDQVKVTRFDHRPTHLPLEFADSFGCRAAQVLWDV